MAKRRLQYEYTKLVKEPSSETLSAGPIDEANIFRWKAILAGPKGTAYEGGVFTIDIEYPTDYPFKPPKMRLETKIFHPNISKKGTICVDILQKEWSPALTTEKVLISISSLLASPNPEDPLNPEAAKMYIEDRQRYEETARSWTRLYAT